MNSLHNANEHQYNLNNDAIINARNAASHTSLRKMFANMDESKVNGCQCWSGKNQKSRRQNRGEIKEQN